MAGAVLAELWEPAAGGYVEGVADLGEGGERDRGRCLLD